MDHPTQGVTSPHARTLQASKDKIYLSRGEPPINCTHLTCNPILLTINNPATLAQPPEVATRIYSLGANVSGTDPVG